MIDEDPEDNPIMLEIRKTREEMLAEHNGDLGSLVRELQRLEAERSRPGGPVYALADRSKIASANSPKRQSHLAKRKPRRKPSQPA